jgi:hypothetical protein
MQWTPEAINAEIEYRRGDPVTKQHLREVRRARPPRWWQRLKVHQPDDAKGPGRAA